MDRKTKNTALRVGSTHKGKINGRLLHGATTVVCTSCSFCGKATPWGFQVFVGALSLFFFFFKKKKKKGYFAFLTTQIGPLLQLDEKKDRKSSSTTIAFPRSSFHRSSTISPTDVSFFLLFFLFSLPLSLSFYRFQQKYASISTSVRT